ncbi:MAG: DUF554 domain-containing protein [Coriobacteriales bacterium]|nr:DUF554 domain-containing protein [Coriobacteriales bacterium]
MPGMGTIINVAAIVVGGLLGMLVGGRLKPQMQDSLLKANGVCVMFLGAAGALSGMLSVGSDGVLASGRSLLIIASVLAGTFLGELLDLDGRLVRFGEWLKQASGSGGDRSFVEGFVTASMTVCIGAMAVMGAVNDGLFHDVSILVSKAILDFVIVMVMACSLGKGCAFSAIPVGVFQGSVTALAVLIQPLLTEAALGNLSLVGSILIFCVGVNLVWGPKIKVVNMLPSVLVAPALAFLPFAL